MRKFYVMINGKQQGPYTIDQIKAMGCDNSTYVFNKEVSNQWIKLEEVPDFNSPTTYHPTEPTFKNPLATPPKTWLLESILVTIFCCLPFGIAGIVNAAKVETRFYSGDISGAERASQSAKQNTTISFWLGIAGLVIYFLVILSSM